MLRHRPNRQPTVALLFSLGLLGGCANVGPATSSVAALVEPYKIDIVQGNVVTREQVAVLKPGMPRNSVRDVLGSALLVSVFHADRWDYVFTLKRQGAQPQSRRVTVFFNNDVLDRVEADDLPSEAEFAATLRADRKPGPLPALEAPKEKLQDFPAAQPQPTPPAAAAPATSYPPLEPPTR